MLGFSSPPVDGCQGLDEAQWRSELDPKLMPIGWADRGLVPNVMVHGSDMVTGTGSQHDTTLAD